MIKQLKSASILVRQVLTLATPYGKRKLLAVASISVVQGFFQVIGVASIFPFLALASNPEKLTDSSFAKYLPDWSSDQILIAAGCLAIAMQFLSNGINLLSDFVRANYARNYCNWMRSGLLTEMISRPYSNFLNQNSSVLLKKVSTDVVQYTYDVLLPLLDSFAKLVTVTFLLATLLWINPVVAVIATSLFGSFYFLVFRNLATLRRKTSDGLKTANRGIIQEAQHLLAGIKAIKVHRAELSFLEAFSIHSSSQAYHIKWRPVFQNGPKYLVEPIALGVLVGIVLFFIARGESLAKLIPALGVMAAASYRLLPALQGLYGQITAVSSQRHSLEEVYGEFISNGVSVQKVRANKESRFSTPDPLRWNNTLELRDVSFLYQNSRIAPIEGLSFELEKNCSLGILGPSGSGKSTLVDLILGLLCPTSGRVLIDGKELTSKNVREWHAGIGYVPQEIFLPDKTIEANIAFGVAEEMVDHSRLREVAEMAQILSWIENELENGWQTSVGERGVRLSGGQKQRIGLARALYHSPSLLILDEATSALDIATEAEVMGAINNLRGEITIIIVAHRLSTIESCDTKIDLGTMANKDHNSSIK